MEVKIKCLHCGKSNFIKKGFRKTGNRGKIQVYRCLDCSRKFTNDEGFYRMRNSESKITMAIDLYFSNLSSRKVRNHFRRHFPENSSHVTILDWARRYTLKVQNYVDTLQPNLSGKVYADETEIDRKGNKDIFWCSVDWGTRFINATFYSPNNQNMFDASIFLSKVGKNGLPKFIQTDFAGHYPHAMKHTFGDTVEHRRNNVSETGKHNVRIETVFSKIKDRVDDFRGLKALWSAPILLNGIVIQHNWIEHHTTTNQIPCDLAGIKQDTGQNRWLGMIKLSSQ